MTHTRVMQKPPQAPAQGATKPTRAHRPRRVSPALVGTGFVVLVVILAVAAFVVALNARINSVTAHSDQASASAHQFMDALSNDPGSAQGHLDAALAELNAARTQLHGIPIEQMQSIPWVKRNVEAADTLINEMEGVLGDAGPVMVKLSGVVNFQTGTLRANPNFSGLGFDTLGEAKQAAQTIKDARDAVNAIDAVGLMPDLQRAIEDARTMLDDAYRTVSPLESLAEDLGQYVPPALADKLKQLRDALRG